MLLTTTSTNSLKVSPQRKEWEGKNPIGKSLGQLNQRERVRFNPLEAEGQMTSRIKEMLNKVGLSVSTYDTAWVAMVPTMDSSKQPLFPKCLNWIMENQQPNGSWGLDLNHPLLRKDSLSSTLACVLALQKWNVGQQLVHKGLNYIESNIWAATNKHQHSPIGFDVIFPSMIEYGSAMGLNLSLDQSLVEAMLSKRDFQIKSSNNTSNLAYIAEGLMSRSYNWKEVMKYQRSNGSLFNSPSSTASALMHLHDGKCLDYLNSLVKNSKNAVPTIYPLDVYARLLIIDNIEKLGIGKYICDDKRRVLDDVYRSWMQGSEEIFLEPACCAMAFRLLRTNGYAISSGEFSQIFLMHCQISMKRRSCSMQKKTKSILELFKASELSIFQDELILDRIYAWTSTYLKDELVNGLILDKSLQSEVDYALKHPYASLDRIENRQFIENYNTDNFSLAKTSYRFCNVNERELLTIAIQDFNTCQSMHRKELEHLHRWVKKYGLDNLKYARQKTEYCYFSVVADLFQPNVYDARFLWAQNSILATVVDDFFDVGGSMEELLNLFELVERWDEHTTIGYKSEEVEKVFLAIHGTMSDHAAKACITQGRCVKRHLIELWIILLKSMLKEAEWINNKTIPTMDEYISNAYKSVAFGPIILSAVYLLDLLPEKVVTSEEYKNLYIHTSRIGRLINDSVTAKRDIAQGKLNAVSLQVVNSNGSIPEEEAKEEVLKIITSHRKELLRMVVQSEGSIVPRVCKDSFWIMSKIMHFFYMDEDGFSSPTKMVGAVNSTIYQLIALP